MQLLFNCSQALKEPLQLNARNLLGEWMMHGIEPRTPTTLSERISAIALVALHMVGLLFSLTLWSIGELIEIFTPQGKALFNDEVDLVIEEAEYVSLDPTKTKWMGTGLSTFQATSDPKFCEGSAIHSFLEVNQSGLGQGVDILTQEGREQTAVALKKMGANAFRFSVEWADVNVNGLGRYIEAAKFFHEERFELVITLDHWVGNGSVDLLEKPGDEEAFVAYAEDVFLALRPYCSLFLTFNEPNVDAAQKYVMGDLPPNKVTNFWSAQRLIALKLKAHRAVYAKYQELEIAYEGIKNPTPLQVGLSHQALRIIPDSRWNLIARIVAFVMTHLFHESFMRLAEQEEMKKSLDFIGVQYYTRPLIGRKGWRIVDSIARKTKQCPRGWMVDGMKYRFDPQGLLPILEEVDRRLGKEIIITETGTAGTIDFRKAIYYQISLQALRKAQDLGVRVNGIFLWTLFPNLEWQHGYKRACNFGILNRNAVEMTKAFEVVRTIFQNTFANQHDHPAVA